MENPKLLTTNVLKAFACIITLAFLGIIGSTLAEAGHHEHEHRVDLDSRLSGNALEYQLWQLVQNHDREKLSELVSPLFLGGNSLGFQNFNTKFSALAHLAITSFSISNIVESQDEDIRIIAYDFSATGAIPINDHRISVWQRKKHKHHQYFWQLISHSNFSAGL